MVDNTICFIVDPTRFVIPSHVYTNYANIDCSSNLGQFRLNNPKFQNCIFCLLLGPFQALKYLLLYGTLQFFVNWRGLLFCCIFLFPVPCIL